METSASSKDGGQNNYVLTVPMRNGNVSVPPAEYFDASCSYRTYEEWKLQQVQKTVDRTTISSYRTYEEWKQKKVENSTDNNPRFLPYL